MADLTEAQASKSVKLIGSDPVGLESNFAEVSANQELTTADSLNNGGVQASITVGTSAVEGKVGASVLANRKYVIFQAKDKGIFYGFDNTVTTSTGIEIFKDQLLMIPVGEGTEIWFIATDTGNDLRFQEVA